MKTFLTLVALHILALVFALGYLVAWNKAYRQGAIDMADYVQQQFDSQDKEPEPTKELI
jgi:hypothetical protein